MGRAASTRVCSHLLRGEATERYAHSFLPTLFVVGSVGGGKPGPSDPRRKKQNSYDSSFFEHFHAPLQYCHRQVPAVGTSTRRHSHPFGTKDARPNSPQCPGHVAAACTRALCSRQRCASRPHGAIAPQTRWQASPLIVRRCAYAESAGRRFAVQHHSPLRHRVALCVAAPHQLDVPRPH